MIEDRAGPRITLLGGFALEAAGPTVTLPVGSQRLIAFLALQGRPVRRQTIAGTLWPNANEDRAFSSLRSALSRLEGGARAAVHSSDVDMAISHDIPIDLWHARSIAERLVGGVTSDGAEPGAEAIPELSKELLPDWYDDWALVEAEDWRQVRLHALEALADRLSARGEFACAAAAALAAVRVEPLRESPRAALIRVHIAEGNPSEALREFSRYADQMKLELGVEPTRRLQELVTGLWTDRPAG